ncbi:hypothetical protein Agabi119p4_173 [Agaricus bisporus var. burnettii]|uniref:LYR motif-containing protein Cup1-like N-terminal domain-containing protein n=1 Tax=Agaricus bisporus var. burnettii TaxID=192524 RepID=A0A8H7FAF5_AGABI|nr:hypothetical protein Agabi119p4_173 [Agaricus bisporus var. burnettii]
MLGPPPLLTLYRDYLRAIRQLPHIYLRQFYRLKARDDMESIKSTKPLSLQRKKYKRVSNELRKMTRGLQGDWRCFDHIIDVAYGRKGKLKHELLEPFLADLNVQVPPHNSPHMSRSGLPVYSPELSALLTSDISRTTKALKASSLRQPTTLPPQADPSSQEAQLFGPLDKLREKNIRKRFFKHEVAKIIPPLEVEIPNGRSLEDLGIRGGAAQGLGLRKTVEALIGSLSSRTPPLTRRERQGSDPHSTASELTQHRPSRWLRRRYQSLLTRLPTLIYTGDGRYSVERSPKSLGDLYTTGGRLLPVAAPAQVDWHKDVLTQPKAKKSRRPNP